MSDAACQEVSAVSELSCGVRAGAGGNRPQASAVVDPSGVWRSRRLGGEMTLVADGDEIRGVYQTAVGEVGPGEKFELRGFRSGEVLAFIVHFRGARSLTAWVGRIVVEAGVETLETLWHLGRQERSAAQRWAAMIAGADSFERGC